MAWLRTSSNEVEHLPPEKGQHIPNRDSRGGTHVFQQLQVSPVGLGGVKLAILQDEGQDVATIRLLLEAQLLLRHHLVAPVLYTSK